MAQATERVRLGPAALNPFTLHPVEIAGQIAALDAVSSGRAYLGLVQGSWLDDARDRAAPPAHGDPRGGRGDPQALRGRRVGLRGRAASRSRRAPGSGYEPVRPEVPLLIGTWGAAARRLRRRGGGGAEDRRHREPRSRPARCARGSATSASRIVVGAVTVVDEDGAGCPPARTGRGCAVLPGRRGARPDARGPDRPRRGRSTARRLRAASRRGQAHPGRAPREARVRGHSRGRRRGRPLRSTTREQHGSSSGRRMA